MYDKLIEASKQQLSKGLFQLSYDERNNTVMVLEKKNGRLNYVIDGEKDEMLSPTIVYFGL